MTSDDIIHMAGEEVLRVTAKGEFIWHENADEMIESADYSQYPALRHVLKALREAERIKAKNERLQDMLYEQLGELTALRAEKQMRGYIKQLKEPVAETTLDVSGTTCFSPEPAKWGATAMTKQHNCTLDSPSDVYGIAVDICYEKDDGTFWVSNDEYASQVNYCPVCGAKARKQVEEKS